jgi:prepilin-type N-terminal cleavage/methylation domain-containing protein
MRRTSRRGFTLIELLAAMALGTLLMLAMMGVLRSLRIPSSPVDSAIPPEVLRLLRWDLANARRFETQPDGVRLFGLDSLNSVNLQPTHRPTTVIYRVATFAGKSALLRTEQPIGNTANRDTFSQLICPDVTEFAITPLPDPTSTGEDSEPFGRNSGKPLPRRVEVQLTRDAGALVQTTICRR